MTSPAVTARSSSRPDDPGAPVARIERWLPVIFGVLALAVYGLWYWNPAYRHDEYLVAVARTRLPWTELWRVITTSDPAAGPLYLLLKPWTAISSDPSWTRLPSIAAMAVAVGCLVAFVRRAFDTPTAVFAGLLMIFLPTTSRWAQDNRMYALATACLVVGVMSWWRSISGGSRRWSVLYGAAVVGAGLFHLYTLAVIPALVVAAVWVPGDRRSTLIRTIVPPAVAVFVLLPHVYLNLRHPTGSPTNPAATPRNIAVMMTAGEGRLLAAMTALLAVGGSVWAWRFRDRRAIVALGAGWVLIPIACFVLARAVIGMPTISPRYFVFLIPGVCLLGAVGIAALYAWRRPVAIVALVAVAAVAIPQQITVRSVDAHDAAGHRLGLILGQPDLAGLPIVAAGPKAANTIGAATYPDRVTTAAGASPKPVAVVVGSSRASLARSESPYLRTGGPWQPVVQCKPGRTIVLVVALPGAIVPSGNPGTLAQRLSEAVPGSRCSVTSTDSP